MVHRAFFQLPDAPECFFIKVTNLSSSREIEVTHIWFATEPRVEVLNQERRLPARLRLDETFDTWIPLSAVPAVRHVGSKVRVRLSSGKVIKSKLDKHIPPLGYVAGLFGSDDVAAAEAGEADGEEDHDEAGQPGQSGPVGRRGAEVGDVA